MTRKFEIGDLFLLKEEHQKDPDKIFYLLLEPVSYLLDPAWWLLRSCNELHTITQRGETYISNYSKRIR